MAKLVYGMNVSLDGYVDHDKFMPDAVLFRHFIAQTHTLSGSLYGRRLYELMQYWDGDDWDQDRPSDLDDLREFATAWRAVPKWVVSSTLTAVGPNATLVKGDLATAVRDLKARTAGVIEVGGTKLARSLSDLGLIDEYQVYLHPVVLGSGAPYFAGFRPNLRLAADERIGDSVIRLTYVPS
ncbi:dihydrofolate reductase family protein [Devosia sp. SL43]|uniref:dihydrofolate reductase family protein n=1 Tax=Devosia sp. SL43 TaxID=2806348 RepID=UPI001F2F8F46|nr:dihydrofolate reductase family protein [Devosia sp. SL43]UJW83962.1 dihydrofolate reductase family protein [Devosia sp. SL43]